MEHPAPTTPFRIATNGRAGGTVEVDGRDVTAQVAALAFEADGEHQARLTLQLMPQAGVIEGEAVIYVSGSPNGDDVRALDPAEVQRRVWASTPDMSTDITALTLEVVAAMLDEAAR